MFFIGFPLGIINYSINSERCAEEIERVFTPFSPSKINLKANSNFPIINLRTNRSECFALSINHVNVRIVINFRGMLCSLSEQNGSKKIVKGLEGLKISSN